MKLSELFEAKCQLPELETGDTLLVGKFKNRKAIIKGFKTDELNQPVAVTTKGDQKLLKPRVPKLYPKSVKESLERVMIYNRPLNVYKNLAGCDNDRAGYLNAFYSHCRIQFYMNYNYFGVWLLYTDKDIYDKRMFLDKLKDPVFETAYWNRVTLLFDKGFNYVINDDEMPLVTGLKRGDLFDFIRKSRHVCYSGVRKTYKKDSPDIYIENIVSKMQENLELLYPLYDMMAHRQLVPVVGPDVSKLFGGNARVVKGKK